MTSIGKKLIVAGIVLAGAVGYLAYAGVKSGWVYFLQVDEFTVNTQYHGQRVRLHGKAAEEGFASNPGTLTAAFNLTGKTAKLPVAYRGAIPEMFKAGSDVVVEGKLDQAGVFKADVLMTKCASKYEANSPHKKDHKPEAAAARSE